MEIGRNDCELLVDMAVKAGKIAKTHYDLNDSQIWNKSNNSPVTDADIAVNSYLLTELMNARPGYGWLINFALIAKKAISRTDMS